MASGTLQIRSFMNGTQFAAAYLQSVLAQRCSNLRLVNSQDRNDFVQALNAQGLLPNFATAYTAGEVLVSCQAGGQTYVAYAFAETYKVNYQGTGNAWSLKNLYSFLAPASLGAVGDKVVKQGLSTLQTNPQWLMGERQYDQRVFETDRRYRRYSARLQEEMTEMRRNLMDKIAIQRREGL